MNGLRPIGTLRTNPTMDSYIKRMVAAAPPLNDAMRAELAALLKVGASA